LLVVDWQLLLFPLTELLKINISTAMIPLRVRETAR